MATKKTTGAKAAVSTAKPRASTKKPAPKAVKAAVRVVPKVSPFKGTSVGDWTKRLEPQQAKLVDALIALVRRAAPDAAPVIKWAQPVFELSGPLAYVKPAKAHVTFGFWRGAELDDPRGLLEGGDRMKHVKLAIGAPLDEAMLSAWVKSAARLNREKGDPTKKR